MSADALENLYEALPTGQAEEQLRDLLRRPGLRIERIVSTGQASPPGFWYDQPQGEWVVVLRGRARIMFDGDAAPRWLAPGDFIDIAPHRRHRIESTQPDAHTIWLAVHYD